MRKIENLKDLKPRFNSVMTKAYKIDGRSLYRVKLQIADIIIQMDSRFKGELFSPKDSWRFGNFIYRGNKRPHIAFDVKIVKKIPGLNGARKIFSTIHPDSNEAAWSLYRRGNQYILRPYRTVKRQQILLNSAFDKGIVYVLRDNTDKPQWRLTNVVYDSLQIILINYFARRDGIFVHAIGLKDIDSKGRVFIGKSGAGKTSLARLWDRHSRAMILNDDRIIIRKIKGSFYIYGTPWHGDFGDYLISKIDSAKAANLLFIHHNRKNSLRPVSKRQAFHLLYPNLFPTFWDKVELKKIMGFCQDLIENLPCYSLGFRKDKEVIDFVRKIR